MKPTLTLLTALLLAPLAGLHAQDTASSPPPWMTTGMSACRLPSA